MVPIPTRRAKEDGSPLATLGLQTVSPVPNHPDRSTVKYQESPAPDHTNLASDPITWGRKEGPGEEMREGPSQASCPKEILHGGGEGDCTAGEGEPGREEVLGQLLSDDQELESRPPNGPLNPWRPSAPRTQNPRHHAMTTGTTTRTDGPFEGTETDSSRGRSLGRGDPRVAETERGPVALGQPDPPDRTNPPASGG